MENVKMPSDARMLCNIDGDTIFSTKNAWICNSGAYCNINNVNNGLFDVSKMYQ